MLSVTILRKKIRIGGICIDSLSLSLSRKEQIAEQREYKKKKAQKKVQRMKELEQEREEQKSKWQQFNNKAYSKNKKGQVSYF